MGLVCTSEFVGGEDGERIARGGGEREKQKENKKARFGLKK